MADDSRAKNAPAVYVEWSEKDPEIPSIADAPDECPRCGGTPVLGYGLAGGGIGPYLVCPGCALIVAKDEDET